MRGKILFDEHPTPDVQATAYIRLEDVSVADACAAVVSRTVIGDLKLGGALREVLFTLEGDAFEPRRRYNVRVLVDLDGDGQVGKGDYVSTQSYPVAVDRLPASVTVTVHRIP